MAADEGIGSLIPPYIYEEDMPSRPNLSEDYGEAGFTGTQKGMTEEQRAAVSMIARRLSSNFVGWHHGDCIGSDEESFEIVKVIGFKTYAHRGDNEAKQAKTRSDVIYDPKPNLERNVDIVKVSNVLVATPAGMKEERRSGTWHTIRQARKAGLDIVIIFPDGRCKRE